MTDSPLYRPAVPASDLAEMQALYDKGLVLDAWRFSKKFGPISQWRAPDDIILASRLAANLGAPRLARVLHWRAWRSRKTDPEAIAYHAAGKLERHGPISARLFLDQSAPGRIEPNLHLMTVQARVATELRDFSAAEDWIDRGRAIAPDDPWLHVAESYLFEKQDDYAKALTASARALELRPFYRPGLQTHAHNLCLLERLEEAAALLGDWRGRIQSFPLLQQQIYLLMELRKFEEARATLELAREMAPLLEPELDLWMQRLSVTLHCLRDDWAKAREGAEQIEEPYYQELATRVKERTIGTRTLLPVPFVRQHHLTCAPATLAALCKYWGKAADHLEIAAAICYDGTPAHSQRHWAESHGWVAREFVLTWEKGVALLSRGIPFAVETLETTSGHLQAVAGFDELRKTFWIRDPYVYLMSEVIAEPFLERYRSFGPRALVIVPAEKAECLAGLELDESGLYDRLYRLEQCLSEHRRAPAAQIAEEMALSHPKHRLTLHGRRSLAAYDRNTPALLECLNALLEQFPHDGNLNLSKLACLTELALREERLAQLEKMALRPGVDPIFWVRYAQELGWDARQGKISRGWRKWALRYRPVDPEVVRSWADAIWAEQDLPRAAEFYRIAACLGETQEHFAWTYFVAAKHRRKTEEALEFLRQRAGRYLQRSSAPLMTFIDALWQAGQIGEAFQTLEKALAARPKDGELFLYAANMYGRFGQREQATEMLERARGVSAEPAWRRAAATAAQYGLKKKEALEHWSSVLQIEPLAEDAARACASLIAETEGRKTAIEFLNGLCARFSSACALLALRIEWLKEEGSPAVVVEALREYLKVNRADAWGWRELSFQLTMGRTLPDALQAANEALQLDPNSTFGYSTRAAVYVEMGERDLARADLQSAIAKSVDNVYAIHRLVEIADNQEDRKAALTFIMGELKRQVIFGDALSAFASCARGILSPAETCALLQEAHHARPDLWQAASTLVNVLLDCGRIEEAEVAARKAVLRFSLVHQAWLDLGRVEQARSDTAAAVTALERAVSLRPGASEPIRALAKLHDSQNQFKEARALLESAIAAEPLEPINHGGLADLLWKAGEKEAAIQILKQAIRLDPGYDWAWGALQKWENEAGMAESAIELARQVTVDRPGEARSWLILARRLSPVESIEEVLAALDQALRLNPRSIPAWEHRAWALTRAHRFAEALESCSPAELQPVPVELLIRAAWVEAERGKLDAAMNQAEAALQQHPHYYAGWQMLSDWRLQRNDVDGAVAAAEQMARLAPTDAVPLGYLGELHCRRGDREAASAIFARAFALDPDYEYAAFQLFELQLQAEELSEAEETLHRLRARSQNPQIAACEIKLRLARRDSDSALKIFSRLCARTDATAFTLEDAFAAFENKKRGRQALKELNKLVEETAIGPEAVRLWVQRHVKAGRWSVRRRFQALLQRNADLGQQAIVCYLTELGDAAARAEAAQDVTTPLKLRWHLNRLLRDHGDSIRRENDTWGHAGYALITLGRVKETIAWLGDWKERTEVKSWMLYNLILGLQQELRFDEAWETLRYGAPLTHQNSSLYSYFMVLAGFEAAIRGQTEEAQRYLGGAAGSGEAQDFEPLRRMGELLVAFQECPPAEQPLFLKKLRKDLREIFGSKAPISHGVLVGRGFLRFRDFFRKTPQGGFFRFWSAWYYRQGRWCCLPFSLMFLAMTPVAPPALLLAIVLWRKFRS